MFGSLVAEANAAGGGSVMVLIIYVVIIVAVGYFLMYRPNKKEKTRTAMMLAELEIGDTVLTTSGFYGEIIDITEDDVIVEFGNNKNCRIPMQKAAIVQVEKKDAE